MADMFIYDNTPPDTNPGLLPNSGEAAEEAWLEAITGDSSVAFISKTNNPGSFNLTPPSGTEYYILKFGSAGGRFMSHWAFEYDGDGPLEPVAALLDFNLSYDPDRAFPTTGLSHISYFSGEMHTPIPATIYLLGTGLAGLFGIRRRMNK